MSADISRSFEAAEAWVRSDARLLDTDDVRAALGRWTGLDTEAVIDLVDLHANIRLTEAEEAPQPAATLIHSPAEHVLGALLLAGADGPDVAATVLERVRGEGVAAPMFPRERDRQLFTAIAAAVDRGVAPTFLVVEAELRAMGAGVAAGGDVYVRELARSAASTANAASHARLVVAEHRRFEQEQAALRLLEAVRSGGEIRAELRDHVARVLEPRAAASPAGPLSGLSHAEALALDLPAERQLIRDLIPIGAVGTIAGVPETHKSWLAQAIAVRVAQGHGSVLGCDVTAAVPVGYFWQDDSTREEAERIKTFQAVHAAADDIPLRWFLNEGLALPAGIDRLVAAVTTYELGLAILDSFYNFLPGIDLKDEGAEQVVALLKTQVADATGCTVLIVDHMPWATDTNRQRLRAYGGVFKNAATRFGIYVDAVGKNLSVEARGNNIRGFRKHPAYWDDNALELRLVEATDHDEKIDERADQVLEILDQATAGPLSKTAVRSAVKGRAEITDQALERLRSRDRVIDLSRTPGTAPDGTHHARGWIAAKHADQYGITLSLLDGTAPDSPSADPAEHDPVPSPLKGQGLSGTGSDDELERLEALAEEMHQ